MVRASTLASENEIQGNLQSLKLQLARLQNSQPLIYMSLNKNTLLHNCVMVRSSKPPIQVNEVAGYSAIAPYNLRKIHLLPCPKSFLEILKNCSFARFRLLVPRSTPYILYAIQRSGKVFVGGEVR